MKTLCLYSSILAVCIALVTACTPFQPAARPDAPGALPAAYSLYSGEAQSPVLWWEALASPELSRLIDEALADNFSLSEAWYRLQQARAAAVQAGASLYPELEAFGSAGTTRSDSAGGASGSGGRQNYEFGLTASYEVDLWGRVKSQREAALLDAKATEADLHAAAVSLAAEVALRWVQILSQRLQKQLLEEQLASNSTFLELIELRFRKAMVSALDVYQQKQVVENVRAKIPLVQAETQLLMHELALLLGRPPRSDLALNQKTMPTIGQLPPLGLPADLLAARPDVQAAGMRLQSADWQLAEARANRLPALSIGAGAQYGPEDLDLLFDTWLLSLAANLTAPVFDAGRRAAEVDRIQATVDESLWAYRRVVLTAVKEVEDALVRETRQREHIEALKAVIIAARSGLREAIDRYRNGLSDYLPVLTQLLTVQDLEQNMIAQQEQLILYRIGLYRALGGQWPKEALQPVAATSRLNGNPRYDTTD
jgi:NodT family efflux transporter outer membrane factor (OMF) lipoprotein